MKNTAFLSTTLLLSAFLSFKGFTQEIVSYNDHQLAVNKTLLDSGKDSTESPTLLMLSGPTDNWHSDSAWWIVAQNYLAQHFNTMTLDRAGHAGTPYIEKPSYQTFSHDLGAFIADQKKDVIILAFASSNLALQPMLADPNIAKKVQGIVLIDADVLTPHSIKHYSADTEGYRSGWDNLETYIRSGKYDQRIQQKLESEKAHLRALIPEQLAAFMDWERYETIEAIRSSREYQIYKFKETTHYLSDLELAQQHPLPRAMPVVVIDTDFESAYLETIKDEAVASSIRQWRKEGIQWYFEVAQASECGAYWPVDTREHLVTMEQPDLILEAVEYLKACTKKGAE